MHAIAPPGPIPTEADAGFWSACERHELTLRHCLRCGAWHHPPLPLCPKCQSTMLEWGRVEGPGLLYSWTRVHVAMHPSVVKALPYHIGVIAFPDCDGVRLVAWLDHRANTTPVIGAKCALDWIVADTGQPVPVFRT